MAATEMFICRTCNEVVPTPASQGVGRRKGLSCRLGHPVTPKGSFASGFVGAFGGAIVVQAVGGYLIPVASVALAMKLDTGAPYRHAWDFARSVISPVVLTVSIIGWLVAFALGLWSCINGLKFREAPEPTRSLAGHALGRATGIAVAFGCVLVYSIAFARR